MDKEKKDILDFMNERFHNTSVSKISHNDLVLEYYFYKGVTPDQTAKEWLEGIAARSWPVYATALRYMKEIRQGHDGYWHKENK